MTNIESNIIIVAGPTASGKSAHALSLAQKRNGVIINADSQQMYRELPILTARPTPEEEALAPHRLYGTLSGDAPCSAGAWLKMARMEIDWALGEGKIPLVTGGTGLYLKALMEGIAEIPEIDPAIRQQAENDFEQMGKDAFADRLREIDPGFFERLKVHDRQRLIRAFEVWLSTGKTLTWWQARGARPFYKREQFEVIKIDVPREELYRRCDERFVKMVEMGAVEEVKGIFPNPPAPLLKIIGVPELSAYIRGEISINDAIAKAQQTTRNYAKRQVTWFKNQL